MIIPRKSILVPSKMDRSESPDNLEVISDLYADRFPIIPASSETCSGIEEIRVQIFRMLDIVRIYTKIPGKPADMDTPYVVPRGSTVQDVANLVHKDFVQRLKFAKLWGGTKLDAAGASIPIRRDGAMVSRDHVLEDRDIIELHA